MAPLGCNSLRSVAGISATTANYCSSSQRASFLIQYPVYIHSIRPKYSGTTSVALRRQVLSGCRHIPLQPTGGALPQRGARLISQAFGNDSTFPFSEDDYVKIVLLDRAPYGPMKILPATDQTANAHSGVLVFQRAVEQPLNPETPILEIFVAGDTACNIYTQLHGHKSSRPMVHDLMYNLLERAAEVNGSHWQLLRVAIVALENDIFVGRLFFGDAASGSVTWDCDCRPSDGVYLSLRTGCPFYVSHKVWAQAAVPIRLSKVHMIAVHEAEVAVQQQQQQQQAAQQKAQQPPHAGAGSSSAGAGGGARGATSQAGSPGRDVEGAVSHAGYDYTLIKPDDPAVIKLLKRELALAVGEEDYAAAIRLRDHPYLQLHRRIEALQQAGLQEEADDLQLQLASLIQQNSEAADQP